MSETLNSREEQQLLSAIKTATDLVDKGMTPNAAIEKVARDNGFGPGRIRVMGQAYNTGQQLAQWRQPAASILDKLASFELCDPEKVIDTIYNGPTSTEKAAAAHVHKDYLTPPTWLTRREPLSKAASAKLPAGPKPEPYKPDPNAAIHKAYCNIQRAKQAADEARRHAAHAKDVVMTKVASLVTYFKQANHARLPFPVVEAYAREYMGNDAAMLLDMVHSKSRCREKRAQDVSEFGVLRTPINFRAEPFTLIAAALDAALTASKLQKQAAEFEAKHKRAKQEELRPFGHAALEAAEERTGKDLDHDGEKGESKEHKEKVLHSKAAAEVFRVKRAFGFGTEVAAIALGDIAAHKSTHRSKPADPYGDESSLNEDLDDIQRQADEATNKRRAVEKIGQEKKAILGVGIGAAIGNSLGRSMGTVPKATPDMVDDEWMKLEDPEHENELRKIRAHAMINQLMTDPDDPISGHDPDKVLAAYNEISSATPRVAENIATLRPQLRKHLEGHQEPFETKELLDIEHGLARSKNPTPNTNILSKSPESILG